MSVYISKKGLTILEKGEPICKSKIKAKKEMITIKVNK